MNEPNSLPSRLRRTPMLANKPHVVLMVYDNSNFDNHSMGGDRRRLDCIAVGDTAEECKALVEAKYGKPFDEVIAEFRTYSVYSNLPEDEAKYQSWLREQIGGAE